MKKKLMLTLSVIAIAALGARPVFASENGGEFDSEATVTFTVNTDPTDPLNPIDPTEPGTDPGTGMHGPLSIDYVPALSFGDHKITGKAEVYESLNLIPYVQVTDTRGTGAGWNLSVQLSSFSDDIDPTATLSDAKITLKNSNVITNSQNQMAPTAPASIDIVSGGSEVLVMSATEGNGMGTWLNTWLAEDTTQGTNANALLSINTADARATSYTANLNWTLSVTP